MFDCNGGVDNVEKVQIVFHRYGANRFLAVVFAGGDEMGREVVPPRLERHLRREMARNEAQPESVALTLD